MTLAPTAPNPAAAKIGLVGAGTGGAALLDLLVDWPDGSLAVNNIVVVHDPQLTPGGPPQFGSTDDAAIAAGNNFAPSLFSTVCPNGC